MSDVKTPEKRPVRIFEGTLREAEYARTVHVVTASAGDTPEEFTQPEAYAHVTGKIKKGDRIEVTAEDGTWYAEVMVLTVLPLVRVELLSKHFFEADASKDHEAYDVKWAGPSGKWRVLRKSDQTVMAGPLETKSEAVAWVEENAKAPLKKAA